MYCYPLCSITWLTSGQVLSFFVFVAFLCIFGWIALHMTWFVIWLILDTSWDTWDTHSCCSHYIKLQPSPPWHQLLAPFHHHRVGRCHMLQPSRRAVPQRLPLSLRLTTLEHRRRLTALARSKVRSTSAGSSTT